jgi:hypothetical protein
MINLIKLQVQIKYWRWLDIVNLWKTVINAKIIKSFQNEFGTFWVNWIKFFYDDSIYNISYKNRKTGHSCF